MIFRNIFENFVLDYRVVLFNVEVMDRGLLFKIGRFFYLYVDF